MGDPIHAMEVADLLDDVRVIEGALLSAWAEQAEEREIQRAAGSQGE